MARKASTILFVFFFSIIINFFNLKAAEEQVICDSSPSCGPPQHWQEFNCTTDKCGSAPWPYFMNTCMRCIN